MKAKRREGAKRHKQRKLHGVRSLRAKFLKAVKWVRKNPRPVMATAGSLVLLLIAGFAVYTKFVPTTQPVKASVMPSIARVLPADQSKDVPAMQPLVVELSNPSQGQRQLRAIVVPEIPLGDVKISDDKLFTWEPTQPLAQGQTYTLFVFDDISATPETPVAQTSFTTTAEPKVLSATDKQNFYPEESVDIVFDVKMDTSQPAMRCECEGEGKWENDTHYKFLPKNLAVDKKYPYVVPKDLKSAAGGLRVADAGYTFSTPGAVKPSFVGLGNAAALNSQITVNFDQAVEKASAQSRFSIEPKLEGTFKWNGDRTMIFVPQGLTHQTEYTIAVAAGVSPIRFGLPGVAANTRFSTVVQTVKLPVPAYRQQFALSCESAALRMALAYRGVNQSDTDILHRIGYNPRPKDQATNTWDDPNKMFVGDVHGSQAAFTGYGVYAPPVAAAAKSYGRGASVHYGVSAAFISQQIHAGNPVVAWGTTTGKTPQMTSWNVPGGGTAQAWIWQHARTIVGVTGSSTNPTGFYVNDPTNGSHTYWSVGSFMNHLNSLGNLTNQVVVVN